MRALTIIQPFAHLIAAGVKRVENRTWHMHHRGPIAIHAGKAKRYGGEPVAEIAELYGIEPATLAFGPIIAIADMIDCVTIKVARSGNLPERLRWLETHEHMEGPFGIVLDDVRPLAEPVLCKGALGLWEWTVPSDLTRHIPSEVDQFADYRV